jgi:hypothetical protein
LAASHRGQRLPSLGVRSAPQAGAALTLPSLPEELEYRILGRDLVLLDVQARLVVDILRDAIR